MKIVFTYPPNFELLSKTFGIPRETNIVFTYGNTLYIPSGKAPDRPLLRHEETHTKQQSAVGGPDAWWDRYIKDIEFRLNQELEAYQVQYAAMFELPHRNRRAYLNAISQDLGGHMYGNLITPEKARELITGKPTQPINLSRSSDKARKAKKRERQNRKAARR